jgi:hypothetical protein
LIGSWLESYFIFSREKLSMESTHSLWNHDNFICTNIIIFSWRILYGIRCNEISILTRINLQMVGWKMNCVHLNSVNDYHYRKQAFAVLNSCKHPRIIFWNKSVVPSYHGYLLLCCCSTLRPVEYAVETKNEYGIDYTYIDRNQSLTHWI